MAQRIRILGWLIAFTGFCLTGFMAKPDAHHSFAMYDQTVTKTMTGKLVRLIPGSSHSQIVFDLTDAEGKADTQPRRQAGEMAGGAGLGRQHRAPGCDRQDRDCRHHTTVTLYPQRNGANQGAIAGPLILCGTAMPAGGCTPQTGTIMKPPAN